MARPRAVVADDDDGVRTLVERILAASGFEVTSCADGEAAVRACVRVRPELLVVDYSMPCRNGLEVLRSARGSGWPGHAVLMSASLGAAARARALTLGSVAFLHKPFGAAALSDALRRARYA
jgi:CheY-like chemotaxis protein